MADLPPIPVRTKRDIPRAPTHLDPIERRLWRDIVSTFAFADIASQSMLRSALEAHQRARKCREAIDRDGEAIRDRWNQIKPHPLLAAERDARAAFLSAMKSLNLDIGVAA